MSNSLIIKNGRVIDPSQSIDRVTDLLVVDGKISTIDHMDSTYETYEVFDATGFVVAPGFIDLHCHLREPGQEYKETIESGTKAAAAGGFTTVCAMPNTEPPADNKSVVEFVIRKARKEGCIRVLPIGCVTKGSKGLELSEMADLASAGVIGFSDDGHPVADPNIMRQALSYGSGLQLPIINHCEVPELARGASMNEGWVATRLGIKGMPNSAEEVMVARDISLAELTGGHVHLAHVSTTGTLDLVRVAKAKNISVSCEITPHHLTLVDEVVMGVSSEKGPFEPLTVNSYDTRAKVNPPLRSTMDMLSMSQGLKDGTIDFIATDHAPHSLVDKLSTFEDAPFGISVLETALASSLSLVHEAKIELSLLVSKFTSEPASFLNSNLGTLQPGRPADITVFDPYETWTVDTTKFKSKGKNTPLDGKKLAGKVKATYYSGKKVFQSI